MKKRNHLLLLFLLFVAYIAQAQNYLPPKPEPVKFVNDFANFMSSDEIEKLEAKLKNYSDETSTQIVVVTVENLGGKDIKEYSYNLASNWGIGQKGADNGLLILVSKAERKIRIEVGYGLENKITDALSKNIINNHITSNFKNANFYQGFEEATNLIISALVGEVFEENTDENNENTEYIVPLTESKDISIGTVLLILLVLSILFIIIFFYRSSKKTRRNHLQYIEKENIIDNWEKLKEEYDPSEVTQKQEELFIRCTNLHEKKTSELIKIRWELTEYLSSPEKKFTVRLDKQMLEFGKQIIASFMTQDIFEDSSRSEMQEKIEAEEKKFSKRDYESFTKEDLAKIQENIHLYKVILEAPYDHFRVDYGFIKNELDKIKTNEFWLTYSNSQKYTTKSIDKTQEEFEEEYDSIFRMEDSIEKQENMLTFYVNTFQPFLENPKTQLTLIAKPKSVYRHTSSSTNTYGSSHSYSASSSYSYSDASSYSYSDYSDSYSDYSDSYSDFGGGSFGGGGADGDW